jgi:hypothetical protein
LITKKLFIPSLIVFILSQIIMFYVATAKLASTGISKHFSGFAAHFAALFITAFLIVFVLRQMEFKYSYVVVGIYSLIVVVAIELIQKTLPYRTFGYDDMLFGLLGAAALIVLDILFKKYFVRLINYFERG